MRGVRVERRTGSSDRRGVLLVRALHLLLEGREARSLSITEAKPKVGGDGVTGGTSSRARVPGLPPILGSGDFG